jgi:SAM-dependent methyltransferase
MNRPSADPSPSDQPESARPAPARPVDGWGSGEAYEPFVGRWSRPIARELLAWLAVAPGSRWLDVGCGTGAVSETIVRFAQPAAVYGIDRAPAYVAFAQEHVTDPRVRFDVGDAQTLPVEDATFDAAVSGLVLNFVPEPQRMIAEMARAVREGGIVAIYVWDYAGKMQLMRHFWNAAVALDPSTFDLDEGRRFPICYPERLAALFHAAGLKDVAVRAIDVDTDFRDFDDYWTPFLGGQAPAPGYAMSLSEERRAALRERLRDSLPFALDGSIPLVARTWAVRGVR